MGLCVTFVSGLRRSGKSAVIRLMIDRAWKRPPHYLRLARKGSGKSPPRWASRDSSKAPIKADDCGVASAKWIYSADARVRRREDRL